MTVLHPLKRTLRPEGDVNTGSAPLLSRPAADTPPPTTSFRARPGRRTLNKPEYVAGADGVYNLVQGGIARPATGADGTPFRGAAKEAVSGLSARDKIDAYDKALQVIVDTTPFGQPPDLSTLDAFPTGQAYAALFAGNQPEQRTSPSTRPTLDEFITRARAANPGVSDAQLQGYYQRTYGNGGSQ